MVEIEITEGKLPSSVWPYVDTKSPHPAAILRQVANFLGQLGYDKSVSALVKEAGKKGVEIDLEEWKGGEEEDKNFSLLELWKFWHEKKGVFPVAGGAQEDSDSDSDSGSGSESEDSDEEMIDDEAKEASGDDSESESSDSSDSDSDSDSSAEDVTGQKRKRSESSSSDDDSSSDSDSDSDSGSDSDSESSSSDSDAPPAKRTKVESSDSSDEESSDSDSDSDSDAEAINEAVMKPLPSSSSESSSDDSSESSSSDSDSDSESSSDSDSDESDSSSDPSSSSSKTLQGDDKSTKSEPKPVKSETQKSTATSSAEISDHNSGMHPARLARIDGGKSSGNNFANDSGIDKTLPGGKKQNVPFSRIPKDIKVDPKFSSNAYVSYDYADRAHRDLIVTKGKGFTKEKNKKKRGSYRGGAIDLAPKGIKFED